MFQATPRIGQVKEGRGLWWGNLGAGGKQSRDKEACGEAVVFSITDNLSGMATDKVEQYNKLLCINFCFLFNAGNNLEKESCCGLGEVKQRTYKLIHITHGQIIVNWRLGEGEGVEWKGSMEGQRGHLQYFRQQRSKPFKKDGQRKTVLASLAIVCE